MSVHISSLVWKDRRTTGNARLLLLALADMSNDQGVCWPSISTLRERLNVGTDRAVQQLLKSLEEEGVIRREMRQGHSTVYHVTPEQPFTPERVFTPEPPFTRGVNHRSPHPRTTIHQGGEPPFTQNRNRTVSESTPLPPEGDVGGNLAESEDAYAQTLTSGDTEQDAFMPDELTVEPMPRPLSPAKREKERQSLEVKLTAIMAAFRHAKYGKPYTDPILASEFDKMRQSASDLVAGGVSAEQVEQATRIALERWESPQRVTLKSVAGNITDLLASVCPSAPPAPAPTPALPSVAQLREWKIRENERIAAELGAETPVLSGRSTHAPK